MLAAPQATTTTSAENRSSPPSRSTTTSVTAVPSPFVSSLATLAFVRSVTFECSSAGRTPSTSASDFACTRHGKPSHVAQRMQVLERWVRLVEHDPARRVERPIAGGREVVGELLDPRLVRHGRMRVRRARRRLGRVLSPRAMDVVVLLGERVVGLELVVGDRPGRERCRRGAGARRSPPCEAGTAPRRTSSSRLRRSSGRRAGRACRPRRTTCPARRSGCPRTRLVRPVLGLARKPVATLEQEDAFPGRREVAGEGSPACARPDDDDVVGLGHEISSSRSARMMRAAASTSARWENACGKFPRWRPVLTSNSSA